MKQQPDKLFHDKLNSFTKQAPPAAWDRIETGLGKKNNSFIWWSVAASISALLLCTYFFYNSTEDTTIKIASANKVDEPKTGQTEIQVPAHGELKNKEIETSEIIPATSLEKKESAKTKTVLPKTDEIEFTKEETSLKDDMSVEEIVVEPVAVVDSMRRFNTPSQLAFKAPARVENVTIILTADQTREYLITKSETTEATSELKKSSTFKKLLRKAADLKVNQDPFGELRQKKNEILALNFKNEKRGQKK